MAARDSTYFSRLFKAVTRFYQDPRLDEVAITDNKGGDFFDKKSTLATVRYLLPSYRVFTDDNELLKTLYLNQAADLNLRRLLLDPNPILSNEAHQQLEEVNKKANQQEKKKAHQEWVRKFTSEPPPRPPQTPPEPEIAHAPIEVPSVAKEVSSRGQRVVRRLTDKYLNASQIFGIVGALGGGAAGMALGGPVGALAGAAVGGGAGMALPEAIKNNPEVFSQAGNKGLELTSNLLNTPNKVADFASSLNVGRFFAGIFIGLGVAALVFMLGGAEITQTTPSASAAPISGVGCPTQSAIDTNKTSPTSCRYLSPNINIFDTNITADTITKYVDKYSSIFVNAGKGTKLDFIQRVDYIISSSKQAGLNPVIFLGYWKTESNFSTVGNRDMGCVGDNFDEQVDCALGINLFYDPVKNPIPNCARSKDEQSSACTTLKGIRRTLDLSDPIKYPIATFDDFAESYGPRVPTFDGPGTTNNNCVSTYNKLLEVALELNACRVTGLATGIISCPVNNPIITLGSKDTPGGHCSADYQQAFPCASPDVTGRSFAIDLQSADRAVSLPFLNGEKATWIVDESGTVININEGGGYAFAASASSRGKTYRIRFVHINLPSLKIGDRGESGTVVSNYITTANHVHVTIQEDGVFQPADVYFNLCSPK